jgi:DNA-binding SARP family transcriptional activator
MSPPERPPGGLRVGLLGPLLVSTDAGPISVAGQRLRTLVIRLALEGGRMVQTDSLIDAVWGDTPPAGAAGALQTLVSRLRRLLPPNTLSGDGAEIFVDGGVLTG